MVIPSEIIKGEIVTLTSTAEDLKVYVGGASAHMFSSEEIEGQRVLEFSAESLIAGLYEVEIWETVEGKEVLCSRSSLRVRPSVRDMTEETDLRSKAQIIVDSIEEYLGNPQSNVKRYRIHAPGGSERELERHSPQELLKILEYYKAIVGREKRKAAGLSGLGKRYKVRFTNY